jgi:hypothetical protein
MRLQMMKNIIKKMANKMLSRRDNILVENEIFTISHRTFRDGMWWKMNSLLFDSCKAGALFLTQRSEDATPSEGFYPAHPVILRILIQINKIEEQNPLEKKRASYSLRKAIRVEGYIIFLNSFKDENKFVINFCVCIFVSYILFYFL